MMTDITHAFVYGAVLGFLIGAMTGVGMWILSDRAKERDVDYLIRQIRKARAANPGDATYEALADQRIDQLRAIRTRWFRSNMLGIWGGRK